MFVPAGAMTVIGPVCALVGTMAWMVVLLLGAFVSGVSGLVYGIWTLWRQRRARVPDGTDRRRPLRINLNRFAA